jgi:GH43 family beta-xylosidase
MSNPWTISSSRVRLTANNCHAWECVSDSRSERGLHEAPEVLVRHGKVHLVYSCSGSWQASYKLGLLHMPVDADPMVPGNWTKHPLPLFESTPEVFGVGHCSFTSSSDGREDWVVYHAKTSRRPFAWTKDGLPHLGQPIPNGVAVAVPSGLHEAAPELAMAG